ncbi:hypothetical protein CDAR_210371 [Caerostris darwini]|uniref:Uncharacterized protein n=1 Tax=Caerostris darwini TaxID=1538125 RepID=A0AAV4MJ82_9ARAC|nr:hypothetical protein CDAR_210371 [Caerostris darwini]
MDTSGGINVLWACLTCRARQATGAHVGSKCPENIYALLHSLISWCVGGRIKKGDSAKAKGKLEQEIKYSNIRIRWLSSPQTSFGNSHVFVDAGRLLAYLFNG